MAEPFLMPPDDIQPSQLYISAEKLDHVLATLGESFTESIEPIPIRQLDGRTVCIDGHTRAYAAFVSGLPSIAVCWEEDELDWEAYSICVGWCLAAGIRTIGHLVDRVIEHDLYKILWLGRCARMQQELEARRSGGLG